MEKRILKVIIKEKGRGGKNKIKEWQVNRKKRGLG